MRRWLWFICFMLPLSLQALPGLGDIGDYDDSNDSESEADLRGIGDPTDAGDHSDDPEVTEWISLGIDQSVISYWNRAWNTCNTFGETPGVVSANWDEMHCQMARMVMTTYAHTLSIESYTNDLSEDVATIYQNMSYNYDNISANTSDMETLTGNVSTLATDISNNAAAIDSNASNISSNAKGISVNSPKITALESQVLIMDEYLADVIPLMPTHVMDDTGRIIGEWDLGWGAVGFITLDDYTTVDGEPLKLAVAFTEHPIVGEVEGSVVNLATMRVNSCSTMSTSSMDLDPQDYAWIIKNYLYRGTGVAASDSMNQSVNVRGSCSNIDTAELSQYGLETLSNHLLTTIFPTPWMWISDAE